MKHLTYLNNCIIFFLKLTFNHSESKLDNRKEKTMIRISDSELEIMNILWEKKRATSNEIIQKLKDKKWNQNTIRTFINRLVVKKAVGIAGKEGKIFTFVPLIDEKKYKVAITKKFVEQFFDGSFEDFIICLIKDDEKAYREFCDFIENDMN